MRVYNLIGGRVDFEVFFFRILALVSSELDPGMADNLISKRLPYCSSSYRSFRGFMFLFVIVR